MPLDSIFFYGSLIINLVLCIWLWRMDGEVQRLQGENDALRYRLRELRNDTATQAALRKVAELRRRGVI